MKAVRCGGEDCKKSESVKVKKREPRRGTKSLCESVPNSKEASKRENSRGKLEKECLLEEKAQARPAESSGGDPLGLKTGEKKDA